MKLGLVTGYSPADMSVPMDVILEAENLGFESVWTSEAWGSDAVTPAAWILARTSRINVGTAIIQMGARAPSCAAMTAMTLDAMSGGRFILGVGPSGPQVIEGWYGVPYGRPLARTREYISIIRKILARKEPLTHEGEHYQIPYRGEGASGLGKPLRSILHGNPDLRIFTGAFTENGLRTSAEVADGVFPVWMNPDRFDLFESALDEGFARAGNGKSLDTFEIAPFVEVVLDDDLERARRVVREHLALYIGGMGARTKNFYNDYTKRLGYEAAAVEIQDHFLAGRRPEAAAAVPDQLIDDVALVGPADRVRDRLKRWKEAGAKGHVGSLLARHTTVDAARLLAEEVL